MSRFLDRLRSALGGSPQSDGPLDESTGASSRDHVSHPQSQEDLQALIAKIADLQEQADDVLADLERLAGADTTTPMSQETVDRSYAMARAYLDILGEAGPRAGTVRSESELPFPKEKLDYALWLLLMVGVDAHTRGTIMSAYADLARFVPEKDARIVQDYSYGAPTTAEETESASEILAAVEAERAGRYDSITKTEKDDALSEHYRVDPNLLS